MTRKPIFALSMLVLAALLSLSTFASADTLNFSLVQSTEITSPGNILTFVATVSAPGKNSGDLFLNSDSANVDSPLTLDDSGFFFGFPLFLSPSDIFTGTLFTITVPTDTPQGLYDGFFSILGGSDPGASDILGTVPFTVDVVPEPGSLVLVSTGLSTLALFARRFRRF